MAVFIFNCLNCELNELQQLIAIEHTKYKPPGKRLTKNVECGRLCR
jgi:hypothetical protein